MLLVHIPAFPAFWCFLFRISRNSRPPSDYLKRSWISSGYNQNMQVWDLLFLSLPNTNIIFMFFLVQSVSWWLVTSIQFDNIFIYHQFLVCIKIICIIFLFIWIRAAFPRFRRSINEFNWRIFLPLS